MALPIVHTEGPGDRDSEWVTNGGIEPILYCSAFINNEKSLISNILWQE